MKYQAIKASDFERQARNYSGLKTNDFGHLEWRHKEACGSLSWYLAVIF